MAIQMATRTLATLLVLVLASQWTCLQARSAPGDYDTAEYAQTTQSYMHSFATEFDNTDKAWDTETFTQTPFATQDTLDTPDSAQSGYNYYSFASTDSTSTDPPEEGIFVDSPETVPTNAATTTSFADTNNQPVYTQSQYENDEVYFDTSSADTIYKANDDGLSLASVGVMNATAADDMLASVAKATGGCGTGNPVDDCWKCDPNWRSHRQLLASCAMGFGRNAIGGKNGPIYTVTSNADDLKNPQLGTLRYGVTRNGPLWIVFAKSMTIQLKGEMWVSAYKTIDGRGAEVHITGESQITIQRTNNVIIHGLYIHDIKPSGPSTLRVSPTQVVTRPKSDGDGLHIWGSKDVWVDHCYLAKATDGLIDVTRGSTMVTISNNVFENHDKVMLFGAAPTHTFDRAMRVTVAFNTFGKGLIQRLPRCRFGAFHVLNNDYSAGWGIYAIGGSEDPTILSENNFFNPSGKKEVTKRINDNGPMFGGWQKWNWASSGDIFLKGAFFVGSGAKASTAGAYAQAYSASARPASLVPAITRNAGPLKM